MKKERKTPIAEKIGRLTNLISNAKFLVLTALALIVLGAAIMSGDGKNIALSFYKNITGQQFQTFSPVTDYAAETFVILKDKLLRDSDIKLEDLGITVFEESDTSHKYRVEGKEGTSFYLIKKNTNGIWQIHKE